MSEPKEEIKPLDMTSDEAIAFLFPPEAIDAMNDVANPKPVFVDVECEEVPYTEISK